MHPLNTRALIGIAAVLGILALASLLAALPWWANLAHAQDSPSAALELSADSVAPGTAITVTMSFSNLETDSDTSTTDYVFRADVVGAEACEGGGMGRDRYFYKVDEDPETRRGTVSADCPAGDYTVKVTLSSADNTELDSASANFTIAEPAPERTPEPTPEPTPQPTPEPESAPSVGIELSPSDSVEEGETITAAMSFSDLEADSDTSTVDYIFRADVLDGEGGDADGCEGAGLGRDRKFNKVDEDPETRTGSTAAGCPPGAYTLRASVSSADNTELASASAGFFILSAPVVIEPPTLTALSISHGDPAVDVTLSPVFDSGTLAYRADVDVAQVTIAPTASHADATVAYLDGNGDAIADADAVADGHQVGLGAGSNAVKVGVSKDGLTTTYAVTLFRLVTQQQNSDVTLVSNTGKSRGRAYTLNSTYPRWAQGFTTGSNEGGYNLTSIVVKLDDDVPAATTNIAVSIRADDSGNPSDTVFATLTNPAAFTASSDNTFTAPAGTVLTKDTTYFAHLERTGSDDLEFVVTSDPIEDPTPATGWSIGNDFRRYGTAWATRSNIMQFAVVGSAVSANSAATGKPAITGTAQVGQTLTAGKGSIADTNGLTKADNGDSGYAYTYQWIRVATDNTESDITTNGTSSTYTAVAADQGKKLKVKVSFQDDAGNAESRTSDATGTVTAASALPVVNIEAGPSPVTEGTAATFTLSRTGATSAALTVTVTVSETASMISGAAPTSVTFAVGDATTTLSVPTVADTTEERNSGIAASVRAGTGYTVGTAPVAYVTVNDDDDATCTPAPAADAIWSACLTVESGGYFEDSPGGGAEDDYGVLTDTEFTVDGTTYTISTLQTLATYLFIGFRSDPGAAPSRWVLHAGSQSAAYAFSAGTTSEGETYKWSAPPTWNDGDVVSVWITVNSAATGAPTISGTPQVGIELTASTSGIADADGKTKADAGDTGYAYTYQWVRVDSGTDSDISGATSSAYTPVTADQGKTLKVKVSFKDDEGLSESRTSGATGTVSAASGSNSVPVFPTATTTRSVAENTATGQNVGSAVTATDADAGDTLTYSLEGTDAASFGIVSTSGQIQTKAALNHEAKSSYSVTVKASDGTGSATIAVTISVTDVTEPPSAPGSPRVAATSGSSTSLDVSWSKPANKGPAITDYDVRYRAGSTGSFTSWTHTGAGRSTKITGLTEKASYQVQVKAKSPEGDSAWSASGSGTTSSEGGSGDGESSEQESALQIFGARVSEGGSMTFLVYLFRTGTEEVTVNYATSSGTATSGTDFTAKNGTLTFPGTGTGSKSQTFTVATIEDRLKEDDEHFIVTLSNPSNAVIYDPEQFGIIEDDGDTEGCKKYQIRLGVAWEYKTKLNQDGEPVVDESTRYPKPRWRVRENCGFPNQLVTPDTAGMDTWKVERRTDWQYTQPGGESEPGTVKNLGNKTPTLSQPDDVATEKRYNEWLEDLSGAAKGVYDYSYRVCSGSVCSGWVGAHRVWWKTSQYPW